jgi:hypothetical protein
VRRPPIQSPTTYRGRPPKTEDTKTFVSITVFTAGPPPDRPDSLQCGSLKHVPARGPPESLPPRPRAQPQPPWRSAASGQGSKRGARISVLNVAPGEGAHDVAGAFSLLSGQILEVAFEILVDPNGQLGHHLRRDCCPENVHHVLYVIHRVGPCLLPASLHHLARGSGASCQMSALSVGTIGW